MDEINKPLVWLHGEVKTPPFSQEARIETGVLLRRLQQGENLGLPHSRQCQILGHSAMNYGFEMKGRTGELSTALMRMQF